jgi:hypothetical protein
MAQNLCVTLHLTGKMLRKIIAAWRDTFLGNDRETHNETTPAARQKILNKKIYTVVTE